MIEGQEGVSWEDWLALAKACEAHGVPALFRSDHYLNLGDNPERGSLDAWATISALAAVTTTLRLGTLVSPATFRHPSVLAKAVTTADHISGGRIELGMGAGWFQKDFDEYVYDFGGVGTRLNGLEAALPRIEQRLGKLKSLIPQNTDTLHRRSGIRPEHLAELPGVG